MLGLVISDDCSALRLLELTTVCSYLLIGHDAAKHASRWAAKRALLVTTFGGLAMLVGFIMLGQHAGSYRWSWSPKPTRRWLPHHRGHPDPARALSKSAIFLQLLATAAMAAQHRSAAAHAAAMVKAASS